MPLLVPTLMIFAHVHVEDAGVEEEAESEHYQRHLDDDASGHYHAVVDTTTPIQTALAVGYRATVLDGAAYTEDGGS